MERTSRRNLLRAVAAGGAAAAGIGVALRTGISSNAAAQGNGHSHGLSDAPADRRPAPPSTSVTGESIRRSIV